MNKVEFGIREGLGLLRRQFWLIVVTVVVVVGVTLGVLYVLKPVYTAATLVLVDPTHKDLLDTSGDNAGIQIDSPRVDSEVELVKSETTLLRVVKEANLVNDPEYSVQPGAFDRILLSVGLKKASPPLPDELVQAVSTKLADNVVVQRKGLTYLISIQAKSSDPVDAARVANAVADAYIEEQLQGKISAILAAGNAIQSRIADANQAVVKSEGAFDQYISDNITRIAASTGRTDLTKLQDDLQKLNTQRSDLENAISQGSQSLQNQDWQALAQSLKDEAVAKLASDRQKLEDDLGTSTDAHQGASLRAQLADLDTQLTERANASLSSLRDRLVTTQSSASDLRGQLRTDVLNADLPAETLVGLYEVQQNAEIARSQYQALLGRSKDIDAQAYLQVADSRVVSPALPPMSPSFPNPRLILAMAALVGLAGAVGLALFYENYIGGITSADQLRALLRLSVPSSIPRQPDLKRGNKEPVSLTLADYMIDAPLSAYAESVRRLRVGIDQAGRRARAARDDSSGHITIMITSTTSAEGKTTTALALARAYAISGRTTLLVDCDLRHPSLHRQLGFEPSVGLLEYLAQEKDDRSLRSITTSDRASGLQAIVGARQSNSPTDQYVSGNAFSRLVAAATKTFDVVILDTPPIGTVVDGLYLSTFVDVVVMLVRWGATPQRDLKSAIMSVTEAKQPTTEIVAVLNQVNQRTNAYRSDYDRYYAKK